MSPRILLRTYGNFDPDANSDNSGFSSDLPSMTVQSQREEADINVLVKRFGVTGMLPQVPVPPTYGDFSMAGDYRQALDQINLARLSFSRLAPEVRRRFGNDPALFVEFCMDPENLPEMRKMGLAVPEKAQEEPRAVPPVEAPPEPAAPTAPPAGTRAAAPPRVK